MKKVVKLSVFKNERAATKARDIRGRMGNAINTTRTHLGNDLSGYAIVAWGKDGRVISSLVNADISPISRSIIPQFVKDKLEQHVTEDYTLETLAGPAPDISS